MTIKVLEFRMVLSAEQQQLINAWLKYSPYIWNLGLEQLHLLERNYARNPKINIKKEAISEEKKEPVDRSPKSREQEAEQRQEDLLKQCMFPVSKLPWRCRYLHLDPRTGTPVGASGSSIKATAYDGKCWFVDGEWVEVKGKPVRLLIPYSQIVFSTKKTREQMVRNCTTPRGCDRAQKEGVPYVYTVSDPEDRGHYRRTVQGWIGNCYSLPWQRDRPIPTTPRIPDAMGFYPLEWCEGDREEPIVWTEGDQTKGGLSKVVKYLVELLEKKGLPKEIADIPNTFQYGIIKRLSTSWDNWKSYRFGKSKGVVYGRPRFRRTDTSDNTLSPKPGPGNHRLRIVGRDRCSIKELGDFAVPTLSDRWVNCEDGKPIIPEIRTYNIVRRPSGYYLQLCGDIQRSPRLLKKPKPVTAFDPGIRSYLTFEDGDRVENPKFYERIARRVAKLQQEISRKQTHNLILWLNQRHRTPDELVSLCPGLGWEAATKAIACKSEDAIVKAIGIYFFGHLREKVGNSKSIDKLRQQVSKLHEKAKMQRRHFIQKQTTWLARKNATIVMEDGMQSPVLKKRNQPKATGDRAGFEKTGQQQKTEITKKLGDTGYGEFASQLERKAAEWGRVAIRFESKNTSEECPVCGHLEDMPLHRRKFDCSKCGYSEERDRKSAILMLVKSVESGTVAEGQLPSNILKILEARRNFREPIGVQNEVIPNKRKRRQRKRSDSQP